MDIAKEEAIQAMNKGEIPVGAVIVKDGEIIGRGHNLKESLNDVTAHAEIIAIKEAARKIGDWRLNGCEMYVTLEPCPMCAGAIINSRIKKVYIGAIQEKTGACGSKVDLIEEYKSETKIDVEFVILKDKCLKLVQEFFKELRKK